MKAAREPNDQPLPRPKDQVHHPIPVLRRILEPAPPLQPCATESCRCFTGSPPPPSSESSFVFRIELRTSPGSSPPPSSNARDKGLSSESSSGPRQDLRRHLARTRGRRGGPLLLCLHTGLRTVARRSWQGRSLPHACDRTAQNNSALSPKPVHVAIKQ
jgi:hypothetical protein